MDTLSAFKSHMIEIYCPNAVLPPELSFLCLQLAGIVSSTKRGSRFFILYHSPVLTRRRLRGVRPLSACSSRQRR